MANKPSIEFLKNGLYKNFKFYSQPDNEKGRLIVPVSIEEMQAPEEVAKKVIKIADETLKNI